MWIWVTENELASMHDDIQSMRTKLNKIYDQLVVNNRLTQAVAADLKTDFEQMEKQMGAMDDAVAALGTQVQANTDAETSAAGLLSQLADLIRQNATNPQAVTDLATKLKASADALAAAIVANTPSA